MYTFNIYIYIYSIYHQSPQSNLPPAPCARWWRPPSRRVPLVSPRSPALRWWPGGGAFRISHQWDVAYEVWETYGGKHMGQMMSMFKGNGDYRWFHIETSMSLGHVHPLSFVMNKHIYNIYNIWVIVNWDHRPIGRFEIWKSKILEITDQTSNYDWWET